MANDKWIDHIYPQASQGEVSEFVRLWEAIMDIRLNNAVEDEISVGDGRWMGNTPSVPKL
jgi:hypothetical protein